ncbi:MAG: hypothetical protein PHX45_01860 [Acidobacteriota bacterium]|nr:hypothetical protein [Acidobacteriota bacterium]
MKKLLIAGLLTAVCACPFLEAVAPRKWEIRTKEDFLKGKFDGVAVSVDGVVSLAPKADKIEGPTEEFYLSLLAAADGALFLGTGHSGKIYRIGKDGKSELYFQAPEMDVTCLVQDRGGALYAGTSPNGRIYRISAKQKSVEFFNPNEKYIWDLMFLESGNLLAAVGESGGIYEISPQGDGKQILKAAENHILCLRRNPGGGIIAGSGGDGLVYRLTPDMRASVLFESPYEEIKSIAFDKAGNIYAAASGISAKSKKEEEVPAAAKSGTEVKITVTPSGADIVPAGAAGQKESSGLFRISPEGIAKRIWESDEELIYSLIWRAEDGRVVFGTGNRGRIYSIDKDEKVSLLVQENSEQIYLLSPQNSNIYVLANNPCYLGTLAPERRFTGEYTSSVLDARALSSWGRISWDGELGAGALIQLQTRSGNSSEPNSTWSDWSPPYQKPEEQILSPKSRYLQFKVLFRTQTGTISPSVRRVSLYYLQTNAAPSVSRIEMLPPNEVFIKMPEQEDVILGAEKNPADAAGGKEQAKPVVMAKKAERKGFRTIHWDADDENDDTLTYAVSIRRDGDKTWRLLQDKWADPIFAFDTLSFPDGTYFVQIVASDAPSNPLGTELKAERASRPFVIDNSLPVVKNFSAVRSGAALDVSFLAEDEYSNIEEVKYLVRPDEWRVVFPVDGIADSRSESFKFTVKTAAGSSDLITVRVKDAFGNVGVHRQTF